jgi:hypothetical protein
MPSVNRRVAFAAATGHSPSQAEASHFEIASQCASAVQMEFSRVSLQAPVSSTCPFDAQSLLAVSAQKCLRQMPSASKSETVLELSFAAMQVPQGVPTGALT